MSETWTCPKCGTENEREFGEEKICTICGHNESYYEALPDDNGKETPGYY